MAESCANIAPNTLELGTGARASKELSAREINEILKQPMPVHGDGYPRGYPLQAAFLSSEPSLSIYRGFGYLHSRVMLELQEQLRELEEELKNLDDDHAFSNDSMEKLRVRSRMADQHAARQEYQARRKRPRTDQSNRGIGSGENHKADDEEQAQQGNNPILSERTVLLAKIEDRLLRYDKILIKARELAEFQRPNDRDWVNVRGWFWNNKPLSNEQEELFIQMKDDLVTLKPRDDSGKLDTWIDYAVTILPKCMNKFFVNTSPKGFQDPYLRFTHTGRVEKIAILVVVLIIIFLLATPVFIMYRITWDSSRTSTFLNIGLLIVFSLLFSASMGLITKAKRAELFAATAAYCAVLIVFIGNFSSNAT